VVSDGSNSIDNRNPSLFLMTLFLFEFCPNITVRLTFQPRKGIGSLAGFLGQILRIFLIGWRSTLPYIMVLSITPACTKFRHLLNIYFGLCLCFTAICNRGW